MYEKLIDKFKMGVKRTDFSFYGKNFEEGRIKNQEYFDLYLKRKDAEKRLMRISIYKGNKPYYNPWVEMFSIKDVLIFGDERFEYFGSKVENELLDILTSPMESGGRIFIEYQQDEETMEELSKGVPEPCSRLGYKLFKRGFTWFKDWYFSEGFHEGNQKLQGEKPIDEKHRKNQRDHIQKQLTNFLGTLKEQKDDEVEKTVIERAKNLLKKVEG
ncbi:MAG: DUF1122 family protein [Candidatus Thermoplasmatota archaeon]